MNTSRKEMDWLPCFTIINVMLQCFLFKILKKYNESFLLSKGARMSSTFLN